MYEAVRPRPDGDSTVRRFVATAARHGYEGLVVRSRAACRATDLDAVGEEFGVDVVDAVEIDADAPESASGAVGNFRPDHTVLCVRGGTDRLNRFAVEQPQVDVLTRPMAGAGDVNHVLAAEAARNGVRIEFDLGPVLRSNGGPRVQALSDLRKLRELVADADAPFVVSAGPRSHLGLRSPRDLAAVGAAVGFDPETVEVGLAEWGRVAGRNRERRSDAFVEPGVSVRDDPEGEP